MQHLHHAVGFPFVEVQSGMAQSLPRSLFITAQHRHVEHQQGMQASFQRSRKPFDATTVAVLIRTTINAL